MRPSCQFICIFICDTYIKFNRVQSIHKMIRKKGQQKNKEEIKKIE